MLAVLLAASETETDVAASGALSELGIARRESLMTEMMRVGAVATAAAVALLVGAVGGAQASPPMAASATFTQTANTGFEIRFAGPNTIFEATNEGLVVGTLSGSWEDSIRVVIHPNGLFTAQNTITCECTVDGKEGVLELMVVNTGEPVSPDSAVFDGSAVVTGGTGGLTGLRGVFDVEGTVDLSSGLSTYTALGKIHFHP